MSAQKTTQINLLPKDKFAASTVGRILTWLLSTFRIIVIMVEMVVMVAFLSRFWLDAKNSDLDDEIEQKKALIVASKEFEKEFKKTQQRINILSTLMEKDKPFSKIASIVPPLVPSEIYLKSFSLISEGVLITGTSPSELEIAQLMANLESDANIDKVNLNQIKEANETESRLDFTLNIALKNK